MKTVVDDGDRRIVQEVIDWMRRQRVYQPRPNPDAATDPQTPEVWIVKTPGGGVPAIAGTTPGTATCNLYRILSNVLVQDYGTKDVYNLGDAIPANTYTTAQRDKTGSLLIDQPPLADVDLTIRSLDGSVDVDYSVPGFIDLSVNFPGTDTGTATADTGTGTGTHDEDDVGIVTINGDPTANQTIDCIDGSVTITKPSAGIVRLSVNFPSDPDPDTGTSPGSGNEVTGTGTGVGPCDAVELYETDVRCEVGALNLYRRTVWLELVNGCLAKVVGGWTFLRTVGCCEDTCTEYWWCISPPANTGTWTDFSDGSISYATCRQMTVPEKDALLVSGYVLHGGPFAALTDCQNACTDTGTGSIEYWWCMSPPDDTGTGTFGGDTGTGTSISNAQCLQMTVDHKDVLLSLGWTAHGGPYFTEAKCLAHCVYPETTGTGTATGGGGPVTVGSLTRRPLGSAEGSGSLGLPVTLPGITLNAGERLIVVVGRFDAVFGGGSSPTATYGGNSMTQRNTGNQLVYGTGGDGTGFLRVRIFDYNSAGNDTQTITVTNPIGDTNDLMVIAVAVNAQTSANDANSGGLGTAPTQIAPGVGTPAESYVQHAFVVANPGGPVTWSVGTSGGQDVTMTVGGKVIILTEGYLFVDQTASADSQLGFTPDGWASVMERVVQP